MSVPVKQEPEIVSAHDASADTATMEAVVAAAPPEKVADGESPRGRGGFRGSRPPIRSRGGARGMFPRIPYRGRATIPRGSWSRGGFERGSYRGSFRGYSGFPERGGYRGAPRGSFRGYRGEARGSFRSRGTFRGRGVYEGGRGAYSYSSRGSYDEGRGSYRGRGYAPRGDYDSGYKRGAPRGGYGGPPIKRMRIDDPYRPSSASYDRGYGASSYGGYDEDIYDYKPSPSYRSRYETRGGYYSSNGAY